MASGVGKAEANENIGIVDPAADAGEKGEGDKVRGAVCIRDILAAAKGKRRAKFGQGAGKMRAAR